MCVCVCHKVNEIAAAAADKMFEKRSRHQKALAQMPPNRPEKKRDRESEKGREVESEMRQVR